jgi:hypothetical protein
MASRRAWSSAFAGALIPGPKKPGPGVGPGPLDAAGHERRVEAHVEARWRAHVPGMHERVGDQSGDEHLEGDLAEAAQLHDAGQRLRAQGRRTRLARGAPGAERVGRHELAGVRARGAPSPDS